MGHACTHGNFREPPPNGEHPLVAVLAVLAIVAAILLITWARFEVHGTGDLEAAIAAEKSAAPPKPREERQVDEAVTANRFATGLSP